MANINIYGTLYNNTTDPTIAYAAQVYDETLSLYLSLINQTLIERSVTYTPSISSGTAIGTLNINGTNYTLYYLDTTYSAATSSTLGLVRLGSDTEQTVAANTVTTTANRTYAVQVNSDNQLVVNVPWSNTTYSVATTSANGLMSSTDKTKLDGIEDGADVTSVSAVLTSGTLVAAINGTNIYAPTAGESVTYDVATSTTLGLVSLGSDTVQTVAANEVSAVTDRTYSVLLNNSHLMVVNVPWEKGTTFEIMTESEYETATKDNDTVYFITG